MRCTYALIFIQTTKPHKVEMVNVVSKLVGPIETGDVGERNVLIKTARRAVNRNDFKRRQVSPRLTGLWGKDEWVMEWSNTRSFTLSTRQSNLAFRCAPTV